MLSFPILCAYFIENILTYKVTYITTTFSLKLQEKDLLSYVLLRVSCASRVKDDLPVRPRAKSLGEPRPSVAGKAWTQQISDKPNNVQARARLITGVAFGDLIGL